MLTPKFTTTLTLVLLLALGAFGQDDLRPTPKKLKAKGDYLHTAAKTTFPLQFDTYQRQSVYSFDYSNTNIGVVYERQELNKKTTISIYIYPAGDGIEGRLRREYLNSMQSIANLSDNGLYATQFPVKHIGDKYICNGFKAISKAKFPDSNHLTVFECGTWFFKLRLTTNELDSLQIVELEKNILAQFDPSRLTALHPLNPKANVHFAKAAFRDSTLLGSVMSSAFKKIDWAVDNVNENERASGFPSQYLDMQVEALKEFVKFDKDKNWNTKTEWTADYLAELNSIIDAGFADEFLMQHFDMVVILPDNPTFDFDGFEKWKQTNKLTIDLDKLYYVISYGQ